MVQDDAKPLRPNVGVVVFNESGKVLAGERIDRPGAYQLPQGGIDPGEDLALAARRELYEETGLQIDAQPVHITPDWLIYEFPANANIELDIAKEFRGQKQKWVFFYWNGALEGLDLTVHEQEFASLAWMEMDDLVAAIVPFKRGVYEGVRETAHKVIPDYLTFRRS